MIAGHGSGSQHSCAKRRHAAFFSGSIFLRAVFNGDRDLPCCGPRCYSGLRAVRCRGSARAFAASLLHLSEKQRSAVGKVYLPVQRVCRRVVPVVGTFALHQAQRKSRCRPRRPMAWLRPRPPPLWGDAITRAALGPACWSYLRDIQRRRPPSRPTSITFSMSATKSLSRVRRPQPKLLRTLESKIMVPVTLSVHV